MSMLQMLSPRYKSNSEGSTISALFTQLPMHIRHARQNFSYEVLILWDGFVDHQENRKSEVIRIFRSTMDDFPRFSSRKNCIIAFFISAVVIPDIEEWVVGTAAAMNPLS